MYSFDSVHPDSTLLSFYRISKDIDPKFVFMFSTFFMDILVRKGPEDKDVVKLTANRNIDVFEKKFIFIPINADLHWSLCVIVNPGLIANAYNISANGDEEHSW